MGKSKTREQIANEYGISRRTLYNMLKRADINLPPGLITPAHQEKIYQKFGYPSKEIQGDKSIE